MEKPMPVRPATRPAKSVEALYGLIAKAIKNRKRDVTAEYILDLFGQLSDEYDTDVNSPLNMGYFCIDADLVSLSALYETERRAANIAVGGQHPAAVAFEHYSVDIILKKFGMDPRRGHGHYTSGGTESNLTAMIVALGQRFRHQALDALHYDADMCRGTEGTLEPYEYFRHGTSPLKAIPTVYVAPQTHVSIRKNARTLIGESSVRLVPMTHGLQMDPRALDRMMTADKKSGRMIPFMVVGTIGATESGIIDPLADIGRVCRKHGVWFHIDAPWGGIAAFSKKFARAHLSGLQMADSITFDPHKTLVPLGAGGCGMFLTPHRRAVARSFSVSDTIPKTYDYAYMSLQGSRANSGLRTMVQLVDPDGLARRFEHEVGLGDRLRRGLKRAGWQITSKTPLPVVCGMHPAMRDGRVTADDIVTRLADRGVLAKSALLRSDEPPSLRLGIISRRTTTTDIDSVVDLLKNLVKTHPPSKLSQ